jgi:hypothetical protein
MINEGIRPFPRYSGTDPALQTSKEFFTEGGLSHIHAVNIDDGHLNLRAQMNTRKFQIYPG